MPWPDDRQRDQVSCSAGTSRIHQPHRLTIVRHITPAAALLIGLIWAPAPAVATPACTAGTFCPDLQLVRLCEGPSCERAALLREAGRREENIVDQGLDGPMSSMPCSRLQFAQEFYIQAVAYGDNSALTDRDRVKEKIAKHCPFRGWRN